MKGIGVTHQEYADRMIKIQEHELYNLELAEYTAVGVELSKIESDIKNFSSHHSVQVLSSSIDRLRVRILDEDWKHFNIQGNDPLYSEWVRYCQRLGQAKDRLSKAEWSLRPKAPR